MGLGPPVCTSCELIMGYSDEVPHWTCPTCGAESKNDCSNLWELPKEQQTQFKINSRNFNIELDKKQSGIDALEELEKLLKGR